MDSIRLFNHYRRYKGLSLTFLVWTYVWIAIGIGTSGLISMSVFGRLAAIYPVASLIIWVISMVITFGTLDDAYMLRQDKLYEEFNNERFNVKH